MSLASSTASSIAKPIARSLVGVSGGVGSGGSPPIEFVAQAVAADANGGTTPAIDTTSADLLVVAVTYYSGSATLTDSEGNTWTPLTSRAINSNLCQLYYCYPGAKVSASHTFTYSGSGSYSAVRALSFRNALNAGFDVESGATGTLITSINAGLLTPTLPSSLFVSAVGLFTAFTEPTYPSGWTGYWTPYSSGSPLNVALAVAWRISVDGAAINPAWAWTESTDAAAVAAVFRPLV
jgi:hypothetical protein